MSSACWRTSEPSRATHSAPPTPYTSPRCTADPACTVCGTGADLLSGLRVEAATPSPALSTPVDAESAPASGMQRLGAAASRALSSASGGRLGGRHQKRQADYNLLGGAPAEARAGYERALEQLARSGADAVWHAGAISFQTRGYYQWTQLQTRHCYQWM